MELQRKKTKHIDYAFSSIYDSDYDEENELVLEKDYEDEDEETSDEEEMDLMELEFLDEFDQTIYFDDMFPNYYEKGAKPSQTQNEVMDSEEAGRCLENLPLYDPIDFLFLDFLYGHESNYKFAYENCESEYGYGYEEDYGF